MGPKGISLDSDALRANLPRTARDVAVPARYTPLLAEVADLVGVARSTEETLGEYFHDFRNLDAVVEGLKTVLLRNWSYFERSDDRRRDFALFAELVLDLFDAELTEEQASALLRVTATWAATAARGPHGPEYAEELAELAGRLRGILVVTPGPFLRRDGLLRDLLAACLGPGIAERAAPAATALYAQVLAVAYAGPATRLDVAAWATGRSGDEVPALTDPAGLAAAFGGLTPALEAAREAGGVADGDGGAVQGIRAAPPEALLALPTLTHLLDLAVTGLTRVADVEDRFAACLYLLKDDTLGHLQQEAIAILLACVREMMDPDRGFDYGRLIDRLSRFFRRRAALYPEMRFRCYEAVGTTIGEVGARRAADHLIDDLLTWPFEYPEVSGSTDEWRTVVNPHHLANVRCWMSIICSNPTLYERLAAALTVQLRIGGVFLADTDLFQRDISRLLAADLRPVWFTAKQLLRAFPVYFSELGAEGELRSVSTEIDEVCGRRDTLMHFLRKQVHAESSTRLVGFCRAVREYWTTLDPTVLEPYVSPGALAAVDGEAACAAGPHRVLTGSGGSAEDERRVALLDRLQALLEEKYAASPRGLGARVAAATRLRQETREAFAAALDEWESGPRDDRRGRLADACLTALAELKELMLDPEPTEPLENIYHKRHIAAGIPSMYGSYSEPKFDALSLTFRVEALLGRLLEEGLDESLGGALTRAALHRLLATLHRFQRALRVDGLGSQAFDSTLSVLEAGLTLTTFTHRQYRDALGFLGRNVADLSRRSVLMHDGALRAILEADPRPASRRGLPPEAVAEAVLRELLVATLGLQILDRYLSAALRQLSPAALNLSEDALTRMAAYDPDRLIAWLDVPDPSLDDQVTLGAKALGLKELVALGYRVPEGFVLTTELFNVAPALGHTPLREDTEGRIRTALTGLEDRTGLRLGDPQRLLTLSIRSGAAISMPGLMQTMVNVGLNRELVEELAGTGPAWTAWDSYRRFVQSWAMAGGVERDAFDAVIARFKGLFGVERKAAFTPEQMRWIALAYEELAHERGVLLLEDPFEQIVACVHQVLSSWQQPQARFFRNLVGVSDDWGTAVIVQRMVLGNLSPRAGAGVVLTHDPRDRAGHQIRLFGDFATATQGEDLVSGLVYPLPISEAQRLGGVAYRSVEHSLERDFPAVYEALLDLSRELILEREYDPQEIEFTFEGPAAEDLYLLQRRTMVETAGDDAPVFATAPDGSCPLPTAVGMGASGGAYAGRVAVELAQIAALEEAYPGDPVLLLRPDTVPEDIELVVRVGGVLTARGGCTSHAAVTARRLGKTAVVDCRDLVVDEGPGRAELAGRSLAAGEWVSIDGRTGRIFLGRLPVVRGTDAAVSGSWVPAERAHKEA